MTTQFAVESAEKAYARSMLLAAPSRSPEIPESADAYGWLVGSWELEVLVYWAMDVRARDLWKAVRSRMSGSCPASRSETRTSTSN